MFHQEGALPHWARPVQEQLNDSLPNRWIRRRNLDDQHIPCPPRSPDLPPIDYFLWEFIKSKVRYYKNLEDLKAVISVVFRLVADTMLSSTMPSFVKCLKKISKFQVLLWSNKVLNILGVVLYNLLPPS